MGVDRIQVYKRAEHDKLGLGVKVAAQDATVADLLEAWEKMADDPGLFKKYATEDGICQGCQNNCCNSAFVIPDLIALQAMCGITRCSPETFLERYCEQERRGNGIARLKSGPCVFLENRICSVYPGRSLICRFYLCTDILGETEELIYSVVTAGVAATGLWLQRHGWVTDDRGLTGFDNTLLELIKRYAGHPATQRFLAAESYADIPLKLFES